MVNGGNASTWAGLLAAKCDQQFARHMDVMFQLPRGTHASLQVTSPGHYVRGGMGCFPMQLSHLQLQVHIAQPKSGHRSRPARHPWMRHLASATSSPNGASSNSDDPAIREAIARLSRLFYEDTVVDGSQQLQSGRLNKVLNNEMLERRNTDPAAKSRPDVIRNLPIWQANTAVLPGSQALLHVHAPYHVHMFDSLFASSVNSAGGCSNSNISTDSNTNTNSQQIQHYAELSGPSDALPWRFGHFYCPGIRSSNTELCPGSSAPLTGVLMEITRAVRLADGKLMLLASALSRIRIVQCNQTLPYITADVATYPDEEEIQHAHGCGLTATLQAVDSCNSALSIQDVMTVAAETTHASAAVTADAWQAYEMHVPRSQAWRGPRPVEPQGVTQAERTASSASLLAALGDAGVLDCLPLPGGSVAGPWPYLSQVATTAEAAAHQAAQSMAVTQLQRAIPSSPSHDLAAAAAMGFVIGTPQQSQQQASGGTSKDDGISTELQSVNEGTQPSIQGSGATGVGEGNISAAETGSTMQQSSQQQQQQQQQQNLDSAEPSDAVGQQDTQTSPFYGGGQLSNSVLSAILDDMLQSNQWYDEQYREQSQHSSVTPNNHNRQHNKNSVAINSNSAEAGTSQHEVLDHTWSWRLTGSRLRLNTVQERGIQPWGPEGIPKPSPAVSATSQQGEGGHRHSQQDSWEEQLQSLEYELWQELDSIASLALRARLRALSLPFGLLQLRPPPPPNSTSASTSSSDAEQPGSLPQPTGVQAQPSGTMPDAGIRSSQGHWGAASEGLDVCAPPEWPLARRTQKLSYALAGMCCEVAYPEQRQAALEQPSITARLKLALGALQRERAALAARAMLRDLERSAHHPSSRIQRQPPPNNSTTKQSKDGPNEPGVKQ